MVVPLVVPLVDEGLGNSAYVVDLGEGRALAVDASRDLRALRAATAGHGLTVAFSADTHLHADFLSGALDLAVSDGATILASAAGGREFPHTGLADGDEVDLGGLRLRALVTPGHTDEHLAFLLLDGDEPVGVFSGGSLIVGAAARTDLVDPTRTEELARAQYKSVQRLLTLPDEVALWPTHGAGSFCAAPPGPSGLAHRRRAGDQPAVRRAARTRLSRHWSARSGRSPPTSRGSATRTAAARRCSAPLHAAAGRPGRGPPTARPRRSRDRRAPLRGVRGRAPDRITVDPAAGSIRDLARLDRTTRRAAARGPRRRPRPRRGRVAGREDRIRQHRRRTGWWRRRRGSDRTPRQGHSTRQTRRRRRCRASRRPASSEFDAGHVPASRHVELGELPARADQVPTGATVIMCGHGERA